MRNIESDDTPHLPCADALIAGTVALMTAWAAPCPTCTLDLDQQRYLLSCKVLSNLYLLQRHPGLSSGLREVMAQARQRWVEVARLDTKETPTPSSAEDERLRSATTAAAALH